MRDRRKPLGEVGTDRSWRRRRRRSQPRPDHEEYPDFILGDGSELDLDDPDVGYAINMAKRD